MALSHPGDRPGPLDPCVPTGRLRAWGWVMFGARKSRPRRVAPQPGSLTPAGSNGLAEGGSGLRATTGPMPGRTAALSGYAPAGRAPAPTTRPARRGLFGLKPAPSPRPQPPTGTDALPGEAGTAEPVRPKGRKRRLSKLTLRVLAINVFALAILVGGLLYLGQYEERLIQGELDSLRSEAEVFAASLEETAISDEGIAGGGRAVAPERARQLLRRLAETTDSRIRLFAPDGTLVADSRMLGGAAGVVEVTPLPAPGDGLDFERLQRWIDVAYDGLMNVIPQRKDWPDYRERVDQHGTDYESVTQAMRGVPGRQVWAGSRGLMTGVAVPIQPLREVIGVLLLSRDTGIVESTLRDLRADILTIFAFALLVTVGLSLYLAGTITRPIRRLALAADQVRRGQGRKVEIPDFGRRQDEIGDLSTSLRAMTGALWERMDATERFAADVSHEIKNPLTSLRSAVETTVRVADADQQRRLMAIILEDVQRLDRLISDISDASRLDSELSKAETEPVDLRRMMEGLGELHRSTWEDGEPRVEVTVDPAGDMVVRGIDSRLMQVFRNLVSNAVSFSPPQGLIQVQVRRDGDQIEVAVLDEGPGIPPGKLDAIFDRFYTERPSGEKFGTHSGLGLSISRQIIEAHGGELFARNRPDRSGAHFIARLPAERR